MKKKKGINVGLLTFGLFILLSFIILTVNLLVHVAVLKADVFDTFNNLYYWLENGVLVGILFIFYVYTRNTDVEKMALDENELEDSSWLSTKNLKKLKEFNVVKYKNLDKAKDGIVIGAKKAKGDIEVTTSSQLHALIVGTTGSGKTSGFVDQNIAVLSSTSNKPSIVITDPKCELYEKHAKTLRSKGYEIKTLDLRNPYVSTKWNPLEIIKERILDIKSLSETEAKDGKYKTANETFTSYSEAVLKLQELKDDIFDLSKDLVYTLCPVKNKDQPSWEEGARNLILGLLLAFSEDCILKKMDLEKLTLFNLYHNITKYCNGDTKELKKYLIDDRDEFSKIRSLAGAVLITEDKTLKCYLSEVQSYMHQLADEGIMAMTSKNEIDFRELDEKPTAMFVIVPDEKKTRHQFVSLFITELYKELCAKANYNLKVGDTDTAVLKKNTYFILDEFGNLPAFADIENMVTVARSRGIRFLFVLQSYLQLNARYGENTANIIKTNCNIKIFIGTDDERTRREFSELCGKKKIKHVSISSSDKGSSTSLGATNEPLISMSTLERLNGDKKGDAIVSVRGYEPIFSTFTPSFELAKYYFKEGTEKLGERKAELFDKTNILYDIDENAVTKQDLMCEKLEKIESDESYWANTIVEDEGMENLNNKWKGIIKSMDDRVKKLYPFLKSSHRAELDELTTESKRRFLDYIKDIYGDREQREIKSVTGYLISKENELMNLQSEAVRA